MLSPRQSFDWFHEPGDTTLALATAAIAPMSRRDAAVTIVSIAASENRMVFLPQILSTTMDPQPAVKEKKMADAEEYLKAPLFTQQLLIVRR